MLREMERKIRKEYAQAVADVQAKMDEHFRLFTEKDRARLRQLRNGKITFTEYRNWRAGQMATGRQWMRMRRVLAKDLQNAKRISKNIIDGYRPEIYAFAANYTGYEIEQQLGFDTSFALYNTHSVERVLRENPQILPPPGDNSRMQRMLARGEAVRWTEGQIQSVTMQAILQGESTLNLARRICNTMKVKDEKAAMRYARTAVNGAENAGKLDSLYYAQDLGVKVEKQWFATLDDRTRKAHRELDGMTVPLDEPFINSVGEIMFPGDTDADADNYWNCRCTMTGSVKGFERDYKNLATRNTDHLKQSSYDAWREGKMKSQDIMHPAQVEKHMKDMYSRTYR